MRVDNAMGYMQAMEARKDMVYLAVTTEKKLYIIKQVGERSWDAFNLDGRSTLEYMHSNRKDVLQHVRANLPIDYICEFGNNDKIGLRKAMMEFLAYGTIGLQAFEINKA